MAQFKPNDPRINRAGRPKGSKNRNNLRDKVFQLIDENFELIQSDLDSLEPRDRIQALLKLLEFSLPKLRAIEQKSELESLSDEDLDRIIHRLISDSYENKN